MRSCLTSSTSKANVLAVVWVQILDEYCIEFSYNASVAGLHSAFSCVSDGIEIHLRFVFSFSNEDNSIYIYISFVFVSLQRL